MEVHLLVNNYHTHAINVQKQKLISEGNSPTTCTQVSTLLQRSRTKNVV